MFVAKNTTGLTQDKKNKKKLPLKSIDWFNKHILKDNMVKALCFTQIDNTTEAVVCFEEIINHKKRLLTNVVIQLSLGVRSNINR